LKQWVEGNVHLRAYTLSVAEGYRYLSRADEYLGYTYRRQYYTLWRYATAVMLLGVGWMQLGEKGFHTRDYAPERWQKMSTAKKQKAIRIITPQQDLAEPCTCQQNTLRENYLDIISLLVENESGPLGA